jgi:DNA-binding MarR family transcriptional regulator
VAFADDAVEVRAQGWRTVAAFHNLIETRLEEALHSAFGLSVIEYTVLDVLSRQDDVLHMRMRQLARATALSTSATTRLVNRLETRGLLARFLCVDDRRGIYTELTEVGRGLLDQARPTYDETLQSALRDAAESPELAPLVEVFGRLSVPQG